jgi:D-glycero-alpha-D-manno-heptose 1-phosphate guanylyltransferase
VVKKDSLVTNCPSRPLLVLAGGFGTRLRTVIGDTPKALAPVFDTPFLYFQIENWIRQGCKSFIFLLHHKADQIIAFLKSEDQGLLNNCTYSYVVEPKPLGTGGSIANAIKSLSLEGDFLVANADTWLERGVDQMIVASSPSILVINVKDVGRYGQVFFDENMLITGFCEKGENITQGWINAGVGCLNTKLFQNYIDNPFSLETDLYPQLVDARILMAEPIHTDFIDIGIPKDYEFFCQKRYKHN